MRNHLLTADQYTAEGLLESYKQAAALQEQRNDTEHAASLAQEYAGNAIVVAMFEDSTRTADSFLRAASRIGVQGVFRNAKDFKLSVGETPDDAIAMEAGFYDVVVMRHGMGGAVAHAAEYADELHGLYGEGVADGLLINAGDGRNEHPTQAKLDGYALWRHFGGQLNGLHHALGGDLLYSRTVRSYIKLTSLFDDVEYSFIAPPQMSVPQDILDNLGQREIPYHVTSDPLEVLEVADSVYMARPQNERTGKDNFEIPVVKLCAKGLAMMKEEAVALHAMPYSLAELAPEATRSLKNRMYRQAAEGVFVRAQLLREILDDAPSFMPVTDGQLEAQVAIYEHERQLV